MIAPPNYGPAVCLSVCQIVNCHSSRFPRRILGTNIGVEDLDLNEPYFILYGQSSDSGSPGQLEPHATGSGNPFVSSSRVNPQTDTADIGSDRSIQDALTRAHGIFMIIAWPVLAVTAIFFAAWMRPALPNGEWFQVHRALMLASLFMGVVGFILIFAAQYNRPTDPGLINLGEGAVSTVLRSHTHTLLL